MELKERMAIDIAKKHAENRNTYSVNRRMRALELAIAHGQGRQGFAPEAIVAGAELFLTFLNGTD